MMNSKSFNRTSLELKHQWGRSWSYVAFSPFNRTSLELKLRLKVDNASQVVHRF